MTPNSLYLGDNLRVLREHFPDECVDLVYLDPPFNSKRTYNYVFQAAAGPGDTAHIRAFSNTWSFERAAHGGGRQGA
jgi:site-specific DNA-methyltransferase (adenine-specific)